MYTRSHTSRIRDDTGLEKRSLERRVGERALAPLGPKKRAVKQS
jgi:hypothetical protein